MRASGRVSTPGSLRLCDRDTKRAMLGSPRGRGGEPQELALELLVFRSRRVWMALSCCADVTLPPGFRLAFPACSERTKTP
jgi:hypothetical protein